MSSSTTYGGRRRAQNGSEYLRGLNAVPSQDAGLDEDSYGLDDDLAMFTNTRFFDFDVGQNTDFQAHSAPVKGTAGDLDSVSGTTTTTTTTTTNGIALDQSTESVAADIAGLDYITAQHLPFTDFSQHYTPHNMPTNFSDNVHVLHASPTNIYAPPLRQSSAQHQSQVSVASPTIDEQTSDELDPKNNVYEDVSRVAAEEDKRRRNTAASARFRIKKKQREQALEKSAKDLSDKVSRLESKIQQLETENKWLKNLIMEKNDGKDEPPALDKETNVGKGQDGRGKDTYAVT